MALKKRSLALLWGAWVLWGGFAPEALAHRTSESFLQLDFTTRPATGRWDIPLVDLEYAVGLDDDGDGVITWGELRRHRLAIEDYALVRLDVVTALERCELTSGDLQVVQRRQEGYAVLWLTVDCPEDPEALDYRLLFELDPNHRGFIALSLPGSTTSAVVGPDDPPLDLVLPSSWRVFADFWREGLAHATGGADHVLFLLALLLPMVLRGPGLPSPGRALARVAVLITGFTAAHAVALGVATVTAVEVDTGVGIVAITAVVAAALNVLPPLPFAQTAVVVGLGLVHGLGFAGVLSAAGLGPLDLAWALVAFNLGVECGQLALALGFLPLLWCLGLVLARPLLLLRVGSTAVACGACLWLWLQEPGPGAGGQDRQAPVAISASSNPPTAASQLPATRNTTGPTVPRPWSQSARQLG